MSLACHAVGRRGDFRFDIDFESPANAVAVVGPSGCGKTTFLHALAGLLADSTAQIRIDDASVLDDTAERRPTHRRAVGYVFQDIRLFPHLTVEQNIAFSRPYGGNEMTVAQALDLMDLRGYERRRPAGLSGGEARRVALARALTAFSGTDTVEEGAAEIVRLALLRADEGSIGAFTHATHGVIPW